MTDLRAKTFSLLFALVFFVGCGGGSEGTGAGSPFELAPEPPSPAPAFDGPTECIGNIYQRPATEQNESSLKPPTWLQGNWIGQREGGQTINIVATFDNIAYGTPALQTSIDNGPLGRDAVEVESTNRVYRFVVMDQVDGKRVTYTQEYTLIDASQIRYSLVSDGDYMDESIDMSSQAPADAINPPSWLVGEWRNELCETRLFAQGDISVEYDNADPSISYADLLSGNRATFQTQYVGDTQYLITATYLSLDGTQHLRFQERYTIFPESGAVQHLASGKSEFSHHQFLRRR